MTPAAAPPPLCRPLCRPLCCAALALTLLAGCATRLAERDGPPALPPPDLAQWPDAEPRIEALRIGGPNKPYEVLGRRYEPLTTDVPLAQTGGASWYGRKFQGRPTASGEPYDMLAMTAAHKTMPIPSYARVRNPANGREVIVRVNDRGPFAEGRIIDLSYAAALKLGVLGGVAPVEVRRITQAEIRAGLATGAARAARTPPVDDLVPGDLSAGAADEPGHWLQLGAFRQRDGAQQLQLRLLREWPGLAVRVLDANGLFRVQLGPFASRQLALDAAERARLQLGLAGQLISQP